MIVTFKWGQYEELSTWEKLTNRNVVKMIAEWKKELIKKIIITHTNMIKSVQVKWFPQCLMTH